MAHMQLLDLTLPTPAENLALDEALLEQAESGSHPLETLRFWEPAQNMAVVGRSSYIDVEVHQDACRELGVPVLRRISGGAAIVTGPGCLMYAVVLNYENHPGVQTVAQVHAFVLDMLAHSLAPIVPGVRVCGTSDLAFESPLQKFSGNSVRCRRKHFLYHGTILYNYPLDVISRCLKTPPRMPDYRIDREHKMFVANLPISADTIRQALISTWNAVDPCEDLPRELTHRLAEEKYGNPQWNELL
jgi:lipoate---protein ligase